MAIITPTITTDDPHVYRDQMELISSYSEGVHVDFADGILAPTELLNIDQAWRQDELITHIHVMSQKPLEIIDDIIAFEADLVILHAEADDLKKCLELLANNGTRSGIALLPETTVSDVQDLEIDGLFEHALIFGGHLGYQGGSADLDQLHKVKELKAVYDDIEIGWDGGVNESNVVEISNAGVDVINVGGYLKNSRNPKRDYTNLQEKLKTS